MRADFSSIAAIGRDYERQQKYVAQLFDAVSEVAASGAIPTLKFIDRQETVARITFCGRRYLLRHEFQPQRGRDAAGSTIIRLLQDDVDETVLVEKQRLTINFRGFAVIPGSTYQYDVSNSEERSYIVLGLLEEADS